MQDVSVTADIHQALADKALLPEMHVVDTGYTDAELLATSQAEHRVRLIGPVRENLSWQAKAAQGFSQNDFVLDWDKEQAVCPQGKLSYRWEQKTNNYGLKVTHVKFRSKDCQACSVRSLCTKSTTNGRRLSLQAKESQAALQAMRVFMASDEGKSLYAYRAGIEGTLSQGVRKMGLRFTRYRGLEKTHLQHLATAAAINVTRTVNWLRGDLPVTSKISPFARLARVV
jgi:transposase